MNPRNALFLALALLAGSAVAASTTPSESDVVLAHNSIAKLTRADYDAELMKLPADLRPAFGNDPKRVVALINNLLVMKTLAAQARSAGLDRHPDMTPRLALEADRLLAQAQVDAIEKRAADEFDAKEKEFEPRAREIYRVERANYAIPESVSASQIVFLSARRGPDAALAEARDAIAKLKAGADFAALAREVSEDPAAKRNGGELGWFTAQAVEPDFAKAAFGLKQVGDVSEPVQTRYGWHVLRLEGRRAAGERSYDDARKEIMAGLKKRYVESKRDEALAAIRQDPKAEGNEAAVDSLVAKADAVRLPPMPLIPYAASSPAASPADAPK